MGLPEEQHFSIFAWLSVLCFTYSTSTDEAGAMATHITNECNQLNGRIRIVWLVEWFQIHVTYIYGTWDRTKETSTSPTLCIHTIIVQHARCNKFHKVLLLKLGCHPTEPLQAFVQVLQLIDFNNRYIYHHNRPQSSQKLTPNLLEQKCNYE